MTTSDHSSFCCSGELVTRTVPSPVDVTAPWSFLILGTGQGMVCFLSKDQKVHDVKSTDSSRIHKEKNDIFVCLLDYQWTNTYTQSFPKSGKRIHWILQVIFVLLFLTVCPRQGDLGHPQRTIDACPTAVFLTAAWEVWGRLGSQMPSKGMTVLEWRNQLWFMGVHTLL